jgi:hypothetical protein
VDTSSISVMFTTRLGNNGFRNPYCLFLFGKDPMILIEQPSSYQWGPYNFDLPYTSDTTGYSIVHLSIDLFTRSFAMHRGESVYLTIYAGDWSARYVYYPDLKSNRSIFPDFSPFHSQAIKITLP